MIMISVALYINSFIDIYIHVSLFLFGFEEILTKNMTPTNAIFTYYSNSQNFIHQFSHFISFVLLFNNK